MLNRERIALKVLEEADGSLPKTTFVKLIFLLRMETALKQHSSFYDFVPYKNGPHSFALYRDLFRLGSYGYINERADYIALNDNLLVETRRQTEGLASNLQFAVANIVERYGQMKVSPLIKDVYNRYRWYALNSERKERSLFAIPSRPKAAPAVYTVGYEGKSVDGFFNYLLEKGIETVIDVRANPVSRKYGFAASRLDKICKDLEFEYQHVPSLGISSDDRTALSDNASRTRLFANYEQTTLVDHNIELRAVAKYMRRKPAALMCVERDVKSCHRSKLSLAVAKETGMEVIHL